MQQRALADTFSAVVAAIHVESVRVMCLQSSCRRVVALMPGCLYAPDYPVHSLRRVTILRRSLLFLLAIYFQRLNECACDSRFDMSPWRICHNIDMPSLYCQLIVTVHSITRTTTAPPVFLRTYTILAVLNNTLPSIFLVHLRQFLKLRCSLLPVCIIPARTLTT